MEAGGAVFGRSTGRFWDVVGWAARRFWEAFARVALFLDWGGSRGAAEGLRGREIGAGLESPGQFIGGCQLAGRRGGVGTSSFIGARVRRRL